MASYLLPFLGEHLGEDDLIVCMQHHLPELGPWSRGAPCWGVPLTAARGRLHDRVQFTSSTGEADVCRRGREGKREEGGEQEGGEEGRGASREREEEGRRGSRERGKEGERRGRKDGKGREKGEGEKGEGRRGREDGEEGEKGSREGSGRGGRISQYAASFIYTHTHPHITNDTYYIPCGCGLQPPIIRIHWRLCPRAEGCKSKSPWR